MHVIGRVAATVVLAGWVLAAPGVAAAKDPLLAGGGGGHCYEPAPAMDAGWVAIGDNCFSPQRMDVATGETVRWALAGQGRHNVTFDGGPSTDAIPADGFAITFRAPGTYPYSCTLHPGMVGVVTAQGDALPGPALEVLGTSAERAMSAGAVGSTSAGAITADRPVRLEFSPLTSIVLLTIGLPLSLGLAARFVGFGRPGLRRLSARR